MRGDKFSWHYTAYRLKKTVQEAQSLITSSELTDWMVFWEMEWSSRKPEHYYLGRIAREICAIFSKNPKELTLEKFMLDFENKEKKTSSSSEEQLQKSKSVWASMMTALQRRGSK